MAEQQVVARPISVRHSERGGGIGAFQSLAPERLRLVALLCHLDAKASGVSLARRGAAPG